MGTISARLVMFLIDTNVISEARKGQRADPGVIAFWADAAGSQAQLFLPAVVVGDLRRGVDLIRHRGDLLQAQRLEQWLAELLEMYGDRVLALDQQIAAIALLHDLTLVTRNTRDFVATGVRLRNPFVA